MIFMFYVFSSYQSIDLRSDQSSLFGDNWIYESIILMQKRQNNRQGNRAAKQREQCRKGWHCNDILPNNCESQHTKEDVQKAKMLQSLKKHQNIIIILDMYAKQKTCISIQQPALPIYSLNQKQFQLEKGYYYQAFITEQQGGIQLLVKVVQELGQFGNWTVEKKILEKYFPVSYRLDIIERKTIRIGQIRINGQLTKVLNNHQGKKHYFKKVNQQFKYPLMKGCKVSYNDEGPLKIQKIDYQRDIKMCGILQIDRNSQFYFISRNEEYDDLNPCNLPQDLVGILQGQKVLFPYSHLNSYPLNDQNKKKINAILQKYLLKGHFKGWPLQSRYPIIQLQDQVNEKNYKSLKDGIIYEAGISMIPFDKNQKEKAQKLAKKFDITNYQRKRFQQSIFTVDGIKTKCHDDALSIISNQKGQYWVQIHIADAAALVQQGSDIDTKVKKRDETLYIKNYYQPMICDPLKNILSLKEKNDKLALSLIFKIDSKGYINYPSVRFQKTIINVSQNLSHQNIERKIDNYPELLQLNRLFDHSKLIDNNYILQSQTKSQVAMSRLIFISSIIPTFLLNKNIKKAKAVKISFDEHLKHLVQKRKSDMQIWQGLVDAIDAERSAQAKIMKQIKDIQKKIDLELNKQRNIIMKRVKEQQKAAKIQSKKLKQSTIIAGRNTKNAQQQDYSDQEEEEQVLISLQKQNEEQILKIQLKEKQELAIQQDKQEKQKRKKEKRKKVLKEVNISYLSESQEESEKIEDYQSQDQRGDQQLKKTAAIGGKKFLQNIFKYPLFNINIKWRNMDEINDAFKLILSKDNGKLYQQYFKRVQIMNRQHFRHIIRMQKDKNKQKQPQKYQRQDIKEQQKYEKTQEKQLNRKNRRNRNQEYQKKRDSKKQQYQLSDKFEKKEKNEIKQPNIQMPKQLNKRQSGGIKKDNGRPPKELKIQSTQQISQKMKQLKIQEKSKISRQLQEKQQQKRQKIASLVNNQKGLSSQDQQKHENDPTEKFNQIDKNISNKLVHYLKVEMDKKSQYYCERYKQFFKNRKLQHCEISLNKDDQQYSQDKITIEQYLRQKRRRLVLILRQNQKMIQRLQRQNKNQKKNTKRKQIQVKPVSQIFPSSQNQIYMKLDPIMMDKQEYYINKYTEDYVTGRQIIVSDEQCLEQQKQEYRLNKKKIVIKILIRTMKKIKNKKTQKKIEQNSLIESPDNFSAKIERVNVQEKSNQIKIIPQSQKQKPIQKNQDIPQGNISKAIEKNQMLSSVNETKPISLKTQKNSQPNTQSQKAVKLSKKGLKKKIQEILAPIAKQIYQKYAENKKNLQEKIQMAKSIAKEKESQLSKNLQSLEQEYNLFSLLAIEEKEDQKDKKSKKQKRSKNIDKKKDKKQSKSSILLKFLDNFELYAQKANFNFKKMKISQIDRYLEDSMKLKELTEDKMSIQQQNRQASMLGEKEQELLKWNNPIRSYESLMVMRIIKSFSWLFEGKVYPTDVIRYYDDLKQVQILIKQLESYRRKKMEYGELNKKAKDANRQISKLQFQSLIRKNPNSLHRFLNVGSPCPEKVKFVFHPILDNLEVDNLQCRQQIYKEVEGKVIIVRQFPLKLRVYLQK